ncbi:MAG TPA: hypothetical protein VEU96_27695 [Bryobacteraceae bacterium]|nr:hypothetical protein [Bryobacteraceae bacterium]
MKCFSALFLFAIAVQAQSISVPLSPDHWIIGEKNERIRPGKKLDDNGKLVTHLGRESLMLAKGFAYSRNLDFQNGTIDADLAFAANGNFIGLAFRVQSEDEYELFFFRHGASGTLQAVQYTPSFFGANAWQLYNLPTYAGPAEFSDQWFHIRVVVAGLEARLFVNGAAEPALVIPDLKQGYSKGSIGLWGQDGGGYFSNVTYTPDSAVYHLEIKQNFLPGALTNWELSDSFDASEIDPATYPGSRHWKWEKVQAENPGMVVIQRYRRDPNILPAGNRGNERVPGSKVVFARTTIHADRDELRKMNIGYSDKVVVYVNHQPLYAGNNTIASREPDFLGLLNADNDVLYLPLKKGANELLLAVTEFFGGWGFLCKLAAP